ncbi:MAG TPA: hypothetical protein VF473_08520, partial [Cyclobacteriaceae bacterium]
QWWLWVILVSLALLVSGIFINALYSQFIVGKPWGNKPMSDEGLIGFALFNITLIAVMLMMFFSAVLEITVDSTGVSYRFFPLIRRPRRIGREDIQHYQIKKYHLRGYGIHYNLRGDKTINVKGTAGIEIVTTDGKRLLFGTQKPDEFFYALNLMKKGSDDQ